MRLDTKSGIRSGRFDPRAFVTTIWSVAAIWFGAVGLTHTQVQAQTLTPDQAQAIDAVFADIDPSAPGCAVGVVSDQELVYSAGYGLANLDYGLPITPQSIFYLGSVGKQFTAAAIAHAARAGHLSLDDALTKWIPEIPEYDRPITIRHLIHHTSGLRDYLGLMSLSGKRLEDVSTNEEILALISRQANTNFLPGDEHLYSNTGYYLLSVIIERATDKTLRAYTQDELLDPLGMTRSRYNDDRLEVMEGRVVGYEATGKGYQLSHPWNFDKVGSGGMYSSVEDLVDWDRNYYTEEVGGAGFTEQLRERGVLTDGTELDYAFGLSHAEYRGLETIGHGGALAGFRSALLRFPEQRTTILIPCNFQTSDPASRARLVADVVLAEYLAEVVATDDESVERPPVELEPAQLDAFTGHWRASMGIEVEIVREDAGLIFIQNGGRTPLVIVAPDVATLPAGDIEMKLTDLVDGFFNAMSVTQGSQAFTAERFDPTAAETWDYSNMLGRYHSEELDATYELVDSDGRLVLVAPPARRLIVTRPGGDRFRTPAFAFELMREGGAIVGFTIDAGRVRGIYFERLPAPD